eukprot:46008_1
MSSPCRVLLLVTILTTTTAVTIVPHDDENNWCQQSRATISFPSHDGATLHTFQPQSEDLIEVLAVLGGRNFWKFQSIDRSVISQIPTWVPEAMRIKGTTLYGWVRYDNENEVRLPLPYTFHQPQYDVVIPTLLSNAQMEGVVNKILLMKYRFNVAIARQPVYTNPDPCQEVETIYPKNEWNWWIYVPTERMQRNLRFWRINSHFNNQKATFDHETKQLSFADGEYRVQFTLTDAQCRGMIARQVGSEKLRSIEADTVHVVDLGPSQQQELDLRNVHVFVRPIKNDDPNKILLVGDGSKIKYPHFEVFNVLDVYWKIYQQHYVTHVVQDFVNHDFVFNFVEVYSGQDKKKLVRHPGIVLISVTRFETPAFSEAMNKITKFHTRNVQRHLQRNKDTLSTESTEDSLVRDAMSYFKEEPTVEEPPIIQWKKAQKSNKLTGGDILDYYIDDQGNMLTVFKSTGHHYEFSMQNVEGMFVQTKYDVVALELDIDRYEYFEKQLAKKEEPVGDMVVAMKVAKANSIPVLLTDVFAVGSLLLLDPFGDDYKAVRRTYHFESFVDCNLYDAIFVAFRNAGIVTGLNAMKTKQNMNNAHMLMIIGQAHCFPCKRVKSPKSKQRVLSKFKEEIGYESNLAAKYLMPRRIQNMLEEGVEPPFTILNNELTWKFATKKKTVSHSKVEYNDYLLDSEENAYGHALMYEGNYKTMDIELIMISMELIGITLILIVMMWLCCCTLTGMYVMPPTKTPKEDLVDESEAV